MTESNVGHDAARDRKLHSLRTALSQGDADFSTVWARYVDFANALDYSALPLEIHQKVLRKCVPRPSVLRPFAARRMQGPAPPRAPHLYEARLKAVMRNIRSITQKPSLDDYNYVLEQFAAVGHLYGSMRVYDELRQAIKLHPDTRIFVLSLRSIAHRLSLPMYKSRRARIQSDCAAFCKTLLDDMNSLDMHFTSDVLDLVVRISKETADQAIFSQLLKLVYGVDLDFPDHPPMQWDHSATVEVSIPQLPKFQPFSTAALNTTIDMIGRSGNVSRLVQAFEVLTQPLPPQASQHYSLEFDDEDDFGVVNPASTQPHQTPHAKPNSTTYNLLLKHLSRVNHSTLARHYLFQAFRLDRLVDRAVRTQIYHVPYKTPAPQFAINRHMLLSVFGTAKRNKDMQLMHFVGYIARRTYRRKKNDMAYYSELRELQWQGRQPLAPDHDSSRPNSSVPLGVTFVVPSSPSTSRVVDAADFVSSTPLEPTPVKYFDASVHLDILRKDVEDVADFYTQEFLPALARKTQRVKERLGRRVWNQKNLYLRTESRRTIVSREDWSEMVNFQVDWTADGEGLPGRMGAGKVQPGQLAPARGLATSAIGTVEPLVPPIGFCEWSSFLVYDCLISYTHQSICPFMEAESWTFQRVAEELDVHCFRRAYYLPRLRKFRSATGGVSSSYHIHCDTSDTCPLGSISMNYPSFSCSVTRSSITFSIALSHMLMSDWKVPLYESPFGAGDAGVLEVLIPMPM